MRARFRNLNFREKVISVAYSWMIDWRCVRTHRIVEWKSKKRILYLFLTWNQIVCFVLFEEIRKELRLLDFVCPYCAIEKKQMVKLMKSMRKSWFVKNVKIKRKNAIERLFCCFVCVQKKLTRFLVYYNIKKLRTKAFFRFYDRGMYRVCHFWTKFCSHSLYQLIETFWAFKNVCA